MWSFEAVAELRLVLLNRTKGAVASFLAFRQKFQILSLHIHLIVTKFSILGT